MPVDTEEMFSIYPGWVYFVQDGEFVKIGYTKDPKGRASRRRTDNPRDTTHILTLWASKGFERFVHDEFASYRHRNEWFRYEGDLKEFVESMIEDGRKMLSDGDAVSYNPGPGWVPAFIMAD